MAHRVVRQRQLTSSLLMIGPVAVVPERQGEGFGKTMMATVLSSLEPSAALPQFLIGDTAYYGQWGFSSQHTSGWRCPGPWEPERLLLRCENSAILPSEGTLGPWNELASGIEWLVYLTHLLLISDV